MLKEETVPVAMLFARLRDRHLRVLQERNIRFDTVEAPEAADLYGDATRLEQALQNLVANAIRHTPDGGTVRVEVAPIDPEHLPYVFDRFYKADAARAGTPHSAGSGLGLSIAQAIVSRRGGTVTASNVPHGGARFEIVLPRSRR